MKADKKKIKVDIKSCQAMICEEDCPWNRVCANHTTAGDFRMEDGCRPIVHLEQGEVFCETYYSEGTGEEYHNCPVNVDHNWDPWERDAMVLVKDLVEKTDNYQI